MHHSSEPDATPDPTPPADPAARLAAVLAELTPWPEDGSRPDGPVAVDATDRLLLDEAAPLLTTAGPGDVVIVGDRFGALALGALTLGPGEVRTSTDAVTAEAALRHHLGEPLMAAVRGDRDEVDVKGFDHLEPGLFDGARLVLLQLPSSLAELTEIAEAIAREAADDVTVLAGGRVKHMTRSMNEVLAASFTDVRASLARQKSRVLVATGVRPEAREAAASFPARAVLRDDELLAAATPAGGAPPESVTVAAHGGTFAGPALDLGTRFLLTTADKWPTADRVHDALDLGSGTGLLATVLALRYPEARVVGTDRSAAAVASTRATAEANGAGRRVVVVRGDAGEGLEPASLDLILLNPPFHDRAAVRTDAAHRMFVAAGRALRQGGELWCVFNTALHYRQALTRAVGPTVHIMQNPKFTVTRSRRR
ncbi:16S rRNA (guanine1207-N2)-methyltransferase [Krasilnikoviella flava]|uniref:16S rRNA (Guanine1207-N2)-methyltransferase n=1 Tax=Krasilnikoviella flava TaxID=526729 RepID=A0A1T5ICK8_9MICO|nr:methyltransferase [Krasilnikoviella flava]SKC36934.1 16S rRNA (guanine1207-N2)-methyltransferase [Krasilnikoviella flava]